MSEQLNPAVHQTVNDHIIETGSNVRHIELRHNVPMIRGGGGYVRSPRSRRLKGIMAESGHVCIFRQEGLICGGDWGWIRCIARALRLAIKDKQLQKAAEEGIKCLNIDSAEKPSGWNTPKAAG